LEALALVAADDGAVTLPHDGAARLLNDDAVAVANFLPLAAEILQPPDAGRRCRWCRGGGRRAGSGRRRAGRCWHGLRSLRRRAALTGLRRAAAIRPAVGTARWRGGGRGLCGGGWLR
jgi:hypothetical protein